MRIKSILITGAAPDIYNTNAGLRSHMAYGLKLIRTRDLEINNIDHSHAQSFIQFNKPDLVLLVGSLGCAANSLFSITETCRSANSRIAFWLHDDPYEIDFSWIARDLGAPIFTNEKNCLGQYGHAKTYYLPLAAPDIYRKITISEKAPSKATPEIFFCGYPYSNRIDAIENLAKSPLIASALRIYGPGWPSIDAVPTFPSRLAPLGLQKKYQEAHFVLNLGRSLSIANSRYFIPASAPGPRTFEAALQGTPQIYLGQSREIQNFYRPEDGVLTADSIDEAEHLVSKGLNDPGWLSWLGKRSREITIKKHLYSHRMRLLINTIEGTSP